MSQSVLLYCCDISTEGDELDSDEESGKDWSDLEEEARKGSKYHSPSPPHPYKPTRWIIQGLFMAGSPQKTSSDQYSLPPKKNRCRIGSNVHVV